MAPLATFRTFNSPARGGSSAPGDRDLIGGARPWQPDTINIAQQFVQQYYQILEASPWQLHHFYKASLV